MSLAIYSDDEIDARISMTERMLFKLHVFLGAIHEGASYLKRIYLSCVKLDRANALVLSSKGDLGESWTLSALSEVDTRETWLSIRKDLLRSVWSLAVGSERLLLGHVHPLSEEVLSALSGLSSSLWDNDIFEKCYSDAMSKCEKLELDTKVGGKEQGHFGGLQLRKPTFGQRYWILLGASAIGALYGAHVIRKMYCSGDLSRSLSSIFKWVKLQYKVISNLLPLILIPFVLLNRFLFSLLSSLFSLLSSLFSLLSPLIQEHIHEPVRELSQILSAAVNKEEGIVSREDLDQSYAALDRMLKNFETRNEKGVFNGLIGLKGSSVGPKPHQTQPSSPSPSNATVTVATKPTDSNLRTQQLMEELMAEYEKDLKNPLQGLVFGSLVTAMLIQVQKLKVHTEAALLRGDQVIASNNLTMAISATFPAIAVFGMTYYGLRHMWIMSALGVSGMRRAEEDVRLTMVEVDRALLDAYAPSLGKLDEQAPGASIAAPTSYSPSHHRGSIFSSTIIDDENSVDSTLLMPPPPHTPPSVQTVFDQQPQQRAHVSFRRKSILTPSASGKNGNGNSKFDFPTELIIQEEDVEEDVAGLASYESSLSAKGRLAFQLHAFYNAIRVLFRAKMSYLNYAQSLLGAIMAPAANSDWTKVNKLSRAVGSNTQWENEFVGIDRDIRDLSSPDFEIGGRRKISTASRMRASYQCLQTTNKAEHQY